LRQVYKCGRRSFIFHVIDDDVSAAGSEQFNNSFADAARSAGNDRDSIGKARLPFCTLSIPFPALWIHAGVEIEARSASRERSFVHKRSNSR
jgi:hypothetical protein